MTKENKMLIDMNEVLELFYSEDSIGASNFETLSDLQNLTISNSVKNAGTTDAGEMYQHLETGIYIVSHMETTGEDRIVKISNDTQKTFSEIQMGLKAFNKKTNSKSLLKDVYVIEKSEDADMVQRHLLGIYINSGAIKEGEFIRNSHYIHISKFLENGVSVMKSIEFTTQYGDLKVLENPFHLIKNNENQAIFGYIDIVLEIMFMNNNEYSDMFSTYGEAELRKKRELETTEMIRNTVQEINNPEKYKSENLMVSTHEGVYHVH